MRGDAGGEGSEDSEGKGGMSRTRKQWIKTIHAIFDPDLAANGQEYTVEELCDMYSGYETEVQDAIKELLIARRLEETSPGVLRRRVV